MQVLAIPTMLRVINAMPVALQADEKSKATDWDRISRMEYLCLGLCSSADVRDGPADISGDILSVGAYG